jgi:hypothetical protein
MYTTLSAALAAYDEMLDEAYATSIAGYEFQTSRALRLVDPICYREGFWNWCDVLGIDSDDLEDDADLP